MKEKNSMYLPLCLTPQSHGNISRPFSHHWSLNVNSAIPFLTLPCIPLLSNADVRCVNKASTGFCAYHILM